MKGRSLLPDGLDVIERDEDAQRRIRYCSFKLGLVPKDNPRGCRLASAVLKAELQAELEGAMERHVLLQAQMKDDIKLHPTWALFWERIVGLGPVYAYRIMGSIGDAIWTLENTSQMWRMAGIGFKDGKPQGGRALGRKKMGGFYPLQRAVGEAAFSLVRQRGDRCFYRHYYETKRHRYEPGGEREGKAKPHSGAMLDMKRLLMSHVWAVGREALGLSVPEHYAAMFGHSSIPWQDAAAWAGQNN